MIHAFLAVNWLAVLTATFAHTILGCLWFVVLFAKPYAASLGLGDPPPGAPPAIFIVGPLVCSAVTIATTAVLLRALHVATYADALSVGALVGFGYLATMTLNIAINPLFPRPFAYALVNAPLFVLGSLLSCGILVAMS